MNHLHENLAAGKWQTMSLAEQLGNIGSEVGRTLQWKNKNPEISRNAFRRALELFDLTIADPRWRTRLKEIIRSRELFCDGFEGGKEFHTSLEDLNKYFLYFAIAARK